MSEQGKQVSMFGIVLIAVSSILVVDTIAASAIIGPSSIGWWLIMFVIFFIPYGLVTAELGTAYPDEGGIVDWVRRAFGNAVGARVAWLYWVNYSLWVPAVFYLFALVLAQILGLDLGPWGIALIAIVMSWVKVFLTMRDLEQILWIPNIGSIFKSIIMVLLGVAGIYLGLKNGFVNEISVPAMIPSLEAGMSYLPVIIFNFMGFEIIAGASSAMKNPSRDIPKAVFIGGLLIAAFYLLATFGILATIPVEEISDATGVIEAFTVIFGDGGIAKVLIFIIGVMFLYTLISNVATWAMGVNRAVVYAAEEGLLPASLSKLHPKTGAPKAVALWNGVIATVVMLVYGLMASATGENCDSMAADCLHAQGSVEDLFWDVFSLGAVTLLASYVLLFPAFLKLRLQDASAERPYTVPGGKFSLWYCGTVPSAILILGILFFFYVPGFDFDLGYFRNVGGGILIALIVGEILIFAAKKSRKAKE
ncbi:MAG: APC family permease [Pseudomonadota bacterium]